MSISTEREDRSGGVPAPRGMTPANTGHANRLLDAEKPGQSILITDAFTAARRRNTACLSLGVYALLVLTMWAPYSLYSGLPAETGFVYTSETGSMLGEFLYRFDPLRIHTKTFYHLPYVIGELLGVGGSYVPFQVVHALLWWSRGCLLFLIVRRLFGDALVAYVSGALVLVHSSDAATQWIGQLNQFGFIFWMMLACYLLTVAVDAARPTAAILAGAAGCLSEYMSLWSYESALPLIMLFPTLLFRRARSLRTFAPATISWYTVAGVYMWLTISWYRAVGSFAYQTTVIRRDWSVARVLRDWWFNIHSSVAFWTWGQGALQPAPNGRALAWLATGLFVAGGASILWITRDAKLHRGSPRRRCGVPLFSLGVVALVFSFPVYLLLASATSMWRTQFLSGIGTALVLTAVILVATHLWLRRPIGAAVFFVLAAAVVVWFGSLSAIDKGAAQRRVWELHRASITKLLAIAPSVRANTIVVFINVDPTEDPFSHHMWCDLAVRLAYPGVPVAATYFYVDGTPSPGSNLRLDGNRWKWDGTGFPPVVREATIANTVIVDASSRGEPLVLAIPDFLCMSSCADGLYNPDAVIGGPVSPRSVRRFRLHARF